MLYLGRAAPSQLAGGEHGVQGQAPGSMTELESLANQAKGGGGGLGRVVEVKRKGEVKESREIKTGCKTKSQ